MCETAERQDKIKSPEDCQQDNLIKRAEELLGCTKDVSALLMRMPADILSTPEGATFFESATTLTESLEKKVAIIAKETSFQAQD